MTMEVKVCKDCKVEQPIENFYKHTQGEGKYQSYCKTCHKTRTAPAMRKMLYGITQSQYDEMLISQNGVCAICNMSNNEKRDRALSVDHDHKTGKVRGLLCQRCNIGLGKFQDDIWIMELAILYLKKHS